MSLYYHFSKISLVLIAIYMILVYYFYQLLRLILSQAALNPNFSSKDLRPLILKDIEIDLVFEEDKTCRASLLNWDENGFSCLIREGEVPISASIVSVKSKVESYKLESNAQVISIDRKNGILGLDFDKEEKSELNWSEFFGILDTLGYKVEYLK